MELLDPDKHAKEILDILENLGKLITKKEFIESLSDKELEQLKEFADGAENLMMIIGRQIGFVVN